MASVIPFRGIFYDKNRARGSDVIAPPYDIITPELREKLYSLSPYNIVRVDAGKDLSGDSERENKYSRASRFLDEWLKEGILSRSERPAFYAYRMDYQIKGTDVSLSGFFGLVRLEQLGEGAICPHEETHSKPKRDRLALMTVSQANTSPIFSLYHSTERRASRVLEQAMAGGPPHLEATDLDGTIHRVWVVEDPRAVAKVEADLSEREVFIADGHHRYETALDYQRAMGKAGGGERPHDYVLMFLANIADGGLTVLPTHRLVNSDVMSRAERLSEYFQMVPLSPDADIIEAIEGLEHAFGLYVGKGQYMLRYKGGDLEDMPPCLRVLDVVILQEMVFRRLLGVDSYGYEMDCTLAKAMVDRGEYQAAFFLNPTPVRDVEEVALSRFRMPPKSTYFYPKVPTGLVINSLKSF